MNWLKDYWNADKLFKPFHPMFVYKLGVFGRRILHPLFSIKIRKKIFIYQT